MKKSPNKLFDDFLNYLSFQVYVKVFTLGTGSLNAMNVDTWFTTPFEKVNAIFVPKIYVDGIIGSVNRM